MAQQRFSPRDEVYLKSTSFEVYMIGGAIFIAGFTLSFILSVVAGAEWAVWPGGGVSALIALAVIQRLSKREHSNKLAELEQEYREKGLLR